MVCFIIWEVSPLNCYFNPTVTIELHSVHLSAPPPSIRAGLASAPRSQQTQNPRDDWFRVDLGSTLAPENERYCMHLPANLS